MVENEFKKNPSFKSCCSGFFVELSGKGNVNFIKGTTEGEEGMCVCVCAVTQWKEQALQLFH